jgi:hypothetical protein
VYHTPGGKSWTFFGTQRVIEPSQGQLSGDAGLLPIRPWTSLSI